ncbi:DUF6916 family protein [Dokdonella fugitiva]|jgi:hypothetical protein|uniref:DUF6916 family protein n=1 Tax=Dokdonella fugitiva TaxID=328517 RepID=UPI0015FB21BA|nr:hypothetical protein [Dokdonella fugitiva]MBA8885389.1 hypothetical protein [Dokdonella fugitiva]
MTASMRHEDFAALAGRPCRLIAQPEDGGGERTGVLSDVEERRERQGYEQFALLFRADGAPQQGLYDVVFDGEPVRQIFLVPIGIEGGQVVYEACFNRAIGAA